MATFKVNDRVRVVACIEPPEFADKAGRYVGKEGTVIPGDFWHAHPEYNVRVQLDGDTDRYFLPCELAPAVDPKADAFLESIRKLKPYEEPKVKPRVEIIGYEPGAFEWTRISDLRLR